MMCFGHVEPKSAPTHRKTFVDRFHFSSTRRSSSKSSPRDVHSRVAKLPTGDRPHAVDQSPSTRPTDKFLHKTTGCGQSLSTYPQMVTIPSTPVDNVAAEPARLPRHAFPDTPPMPPNARADGPRISLLARIHHLPEDTARSPTLIS